MSDKDKSKSGIIEGPCAGDYNGMNPPSPAELQAPTKVYPASSKLGKDLPKGIVEGPASGKRLF